MKHMKVTIQGKIFSLFGQYEVFNEHGECLYLIEGKPSWGGLFKVSDACGRERAVIRRKVLSLLPVFTVEENGRILGTIEKEFTWLRPRYDVQFLDWHIEGDIFQIDYSVYSSSNTLIAEINQKLLSLHQTFTIDCPDPDNLFYAVLLAVAIARVEASQSAAAASS